MSCQNIKFQSTGRNYQFIGKLPFLLTCYLGFRTPLGVIAISGVHGLPIALYCQQFSFMAPAILNTIILILILGRILALRVEVRVVCQYIYALIIFKKIMLTKCKKKKKMYILISFEFSNCYKFTHLIQRLIMIFSFSSQVFYIQCHLKNLLLSEENSQPVNTD